MNKTERGRLMQILERRFAAHPGRHDAAEWSEVEERLLARPEKLQSLHEMERTGGEPDMIGRDRTSGELIFCDCSAESPAGRRSLCYDREGLESRKAHRPKNSAVELARAMGVEILTELQYGDLQSLGEFDLRTSSWIMTPHDVRALGGALLCDRRYGKVFVYHNGAQSYYALRGFRAALRI
jgi:hypothetical protein